VCERGGERAESDGDELGMCTGWRDEGTNKSILLTKQLRVKKKKKQTTK
jgi:hypothetical protein